MTTRVSTETDNRDLEEIKTVYSDNEANELLKKGWKYLWSGAVHIDNMGYNVKPTITLGLLKQIKPQGGKQRSIK
jgi:hypothetical protein